MSPLPSREILRQRKLLENAELARRAKRMAMEQRGLEESIARYWELLSEFVDRAEELGIAPHTHRRANKRVNSRVEWVEGFWPRGGSIGAAPPLRYCLRERRFLVARSTGVFEVNEVAIFVAATDTGPA